MSSLFERFILQEAPGVDEPPNFVNPSRKKKEEQDRELDPNNPKIDNEQNTQEEPDTGNEPTPQIQVGGQGQEQSVEPEEDTGEDIPEEGEEEVDDGSGEEGDMGEEQPPVEPEDELQSDETEVFSDLKPRQMEIKNKELKDQYLALNNNIVDAIDKINKVSHTSYDDSMLDFIVRKLMQLRDLSRDSLLYSFDTRTYIENQVHLQKMITTFNIVANMITEIERVRTANRLETEKKAHGSYQKRKETDFPYTFTRPVDDQ